MRLRIAVSDAVSGERAQIENAARLVAGSLVVTGESVDLTGVDTAELAHRLVKLGQILRASAQSHQKPPLFAPPVNLNPGDWETV